MKFGKLGKRHDERTLKFESYLGAGLPRPYKSLDNFLRMATNAGVPHPWRMLPMDGNDELGCCTIAALAHMTTLFRGLVGHGEVPAAGEVVATYLRLTGGADTGLVMLDVLNFWRQSGFDGDKIAGYAAIDPKNHDHVKLGMMLFGGLYLGFQVQEDCLADFNASPRRTWTPRPLTGEGHCVAAARFDGDDWVEVSTWGDWCRGTWRWWDACVDECYVVLPPEAAEPGFAPGFDYEALRRDVSLVGTIPRGG